MIILISPAKSLDYGKKLPDINYTNPIFHNEAVKLVNELIPLGCKGIQSLMNISPKLSELNNKRFLEFNKIPNAKNSKPAIFFFNGDVYDGINIESFKKNEISYAQKNLRILSGLYGVLKPLDLIQPYRLEMGTKLKTSKGKNLYEWWSDKIAKKIDEDVNNSKSRILINLASEEYFKSVKKHLRSNFISPVFQEKVSGKYKTIGIFSKKARGLLTTFILKNKIQKIDDIKCFNYEGYTFNKALSSTERLIFQRN